MHETNATPARAVHGFRHLTYSILMASLMTFLVTGISSLANLGFDNFRFTLWLKAWGLALPVASLVLYLIGSTMHRANDAMHVWLTACLRR